MRVVVQRTSGARVTVDGIETGGIGHGLVLFVGIAPEDTEATLTWMVRKLLGLRIFDDENGRFDRSLRDVGGAVLSISQFTLFGDARKGTRPSFSGAAPPEQAEAMWNRFNELLAAEGVDVQSGVFGAHMDVTLVNDGPVTLTLER